MSRRPIAQLLDPIMADPERRARVEAGVRAMRDAMSLAELRNERGMNQGAIACSLRISQPRVSQIERQEDVYLSTLREYVGALGGRLEVRAVFPDGTVTILAPGQQGPEPSDAPAADNRAATNLIDRRSHP